MRTATVEGLLWDLVGIMWLLVKVSGNVCDIAAGFIIELRCSTDRLSGFAVL